MAYTVMAYTVMSDKVMAYAVMVYIVMAYIGTAYTAIGIEIEKESKLYKNRGAPWPRPPATKRPLPECLRHDEKRTPARDSLIPQAII